MQPEFLPPEVSAYIRHCELGASMRGLARERRCKPSTVLRQIRKVEDLLGQDGLARSGLDLARNTEGLPDLEPQVVAALRLLSASGVQLLWLSGLKDVAVVTGRGEGVETVGTLPVAIAGLLRLCGLIRMAEGNRSPQRYVIAPRGRARLLKGLARSESSKNVESERRPYPVQRLLDSPKTIGFIGSELMKVARSIERDWLLIEGKLSGADAIGLGGEAAVRARLRLRLAFNDLGDSALLEVIKAYCIEPQSVEALEKTMGLPARSGKALLREALIRVKRIYDAQAVLRSGCGEGSWRIQSPQKVG